MSPLKAIRAKCYDCSYFQLNEIRLCEAVNCALWPFRAGKHPWRAEARKPPLTDANSHRQTAFQDGPDRARRAPRRHRGLGAVSRHRDQTRHAGCRNAFSQHRRAELHMSSAANRALQPRATAAHCAVSMARPTRRGPSTASRSSAEWRPSSRHPTCIVVPAGGSATLFRQLPAAIRVERLPPMSDKPDLKLIEAAASDDPYDLARLRINPEMLETTSVKKLLTTVPVRKPTRSGFRPRSPEPAVSRNAGLH